MKKPTHGQLFDGAMATILVVVVVYIGLGGYFGVQLLKANDHVNEFNISAGCVPEGVTTDPLQSNCAWADFTVSGHGRHKDLTGTTYHLSLTQTQAVYPDVGVPAGFYNRNPVGSTIHVDQWGDIPVEVADDIGSCKTSMHPDVVQSAAQADEAWTTGVCALLLGAAIAFLVWSTRKLVAAKPVPEFVDEPEALMGGMPSYSTRDETIERQPITLEDDDEGQPLNW